MVGGQLESALGQLANRRQSSRARQSLVEERSFMREQIRSFNRGRTSDEYSNETSAESNDDVGDEASSSLPRVLIPPIDDLMLAEGDSPSGEPRAHIFHGSARWAPGQLQGEVRSGSWGLCDASAFNIFEV